MPSRNVALRLTEDEGVLATLKKNGALRPRGPVDPRTRKPTGDDKYVVQNDGRSFEFEPGKVLVVDDDTARGLYMQGVLHGGTPTKWGGLTFDSAMDADYVPVLEIVEQWDVGAEQPSAKRSRKTTCPLCNVDQHSVEALKNHVIECQEDTEAVAEIKAASAR